jgi:hypothetical protein
MIDNEYLLEKFPGKGGWTYALIPEITPASNNPFGWVIVNGSIDGHEIRHYHLMPYGDGRLFLPVKSAIRKKIGKEAGDTVHVILSVESDELSVPDDLMLCLKDEPDLLAKFESSSDESKKAHIVWLNNARHEEERIIRIAQLMNKLM